MMLFTISCSRNAKQNSLSDTSDVGKDSGQAVKSHNEIKIDSTSDVFCGEYLIGVSGYGCTIRPVNGAYEMRNEKGETQNVLYFIQKEGDSLFVYSTKNMAITIKMRPGHKTGGYLEDSEGWPVKFVKPIQGE